MLCGFATLTHCVSNGPQQYLRYAFGAHRADAHAMRALGTRPSTRRQRMATDIAQRLARMHSEKHEQRRHQRSELFTLPCLRNFSGLPSQPNRHWKA
jgi:hypothetical protein